MKPTPWLEAESYRIQIAIGKSKYGDDYGFFIIPFRSNNLKVMVSAGDEQNGWDHVSISLANRCPNWEEMEFIKHMFFADDEWAMQLHAPSADHISVHPYCLHIWRPLKEIIPTPPTWMIA